MQEHLLAQFSDKDVFNAFLYAISEELVSIDDTLYGLKYNRWIDTGHGQQLDGIGTVISRSRRITDALTLSFFGFSNQSGITGFSQSRLRSSEEPYLATLSLADPEYRAALWSKVHKNNCQGTGEDTISSLLYIFNSSQIVLEDVEHASFIVGVGKILSDNEIQLAKVVDLMVRAGGVKCLYMEMFDADAFFGFSNLNNNAKGFGTGKIASIFLIN